MSVALVGFLCWCILVVSLMVAFVLIPLFCPEKSSSTITLGLSALVPYLTGPEHLSNKFILQRLWDLYLASFSFHPRNLHGYNALY